jgi:DNA-binding GntR family transcriptional regulator
LTNARGIQIDLAAWNFGASRRKRKAEFKNHFPDPVRTRVLPSHCFAIATPPLDLQVFVEYSIFGVAMKRAFSRKTLHDELVTQLRDMIVEGELGPGSRISESRLCDHFGISRTPLREALKVLYVEGLVVLLPNKGCWVTRITRREMEEIVHVLGALTALAGELACANIRADELARIRSLHTQMIDHYRSGDLQSYSALNHDIDDAVFKAAGNKALSDTYDKLQMRLRSLHYATPKTSPHWADAVREHEEMVTALAAKDGARFASVARRHVRHTIEIMRIALDALEAKADARRM